MSDLLISIFPWVKSLHVIAVISWMAGLLYLPRLFVYHVETDQAFITPSETLEKWEHLLLRRIMGPASVVTWICGLIMAATPGIIDWSAAWPWIKFACVIGMTGFHHWLMGERKRLAAGTATKTGRQYRMLNEVPTVFMIIIVIMIIVKPF